MPDASLVTHLRWPLYKKCRRAAARELMRMALPAGEGDIDRYLEKSLSGMSDDLRRLFVRDRAAREEWVRVRSEHKVEP